MKAVNDGGVNNDGDISSKLEGPCCQAGFQRLNG